MTALIPLLVRILDEAYGEKGWQGPTLRGAVRGLPVEDALWRPQPGRHNIWEITVHAAYWKYAVRRRLSGEKRGTFPRKGSNWFRLPEPGTRSAWREDVALLEETHVRLRETVQALDSKDLRKRPRGSKWDCAAMIYGVAAHDAYHAGQIRLIKRLRAG